MTIEPKNPTNKIPTKSAVILSNIHCQAISAHALDFVKQENIFHIYIFRSRTICHPFFRHFQNRDLGLLRPLSINIRKRKQAGKKKVYIRIHVEFIQAANRQSGSSISLRWASYVRQKPAQLDWKSAYSHSIFRQTGGTTRINTHFLLLKRVAFWASKTRSSRFLSVCFTTRTSAPGHVVFIVHRTFCPVMSKCLAVCEKKKQLLLHLPFIMMKCILDSR